LEARAERRREWTEKRQAKAARDFATADPYRGDVAFNTQPGHIPARARVIAAQERGMEHAQVAQHHEAKASGLERQLERSIFSDDPDAAEALEAKAAALDAAADRCKAVNAAFRKAPGADKAAKLAAMVEAGTATRAEAMEAAKLFGMCHWERQPFPAYHLTNLRANARRCRERVAEIKGRAEQTAKAEAAPSGFLVELFAEGGTWAHVTFPDFPGREKVNALKAAGFRWSAPSWVGKTADLPAFARVAVPS